MHLFRSQSSIRICSFPRNPEKVRIEGALVGDFSRFPLHLLYKVVYLRLRPLCGSVGLVCRLLFYSGYLPRSGSFCFLFFALGSIALI